MKFDPNTDKPGVATVNIGGHEQVQNGDFDGHPFRGNQYQSGEGGGGGEGKETERARRPGPQILRTYEGDRISLDRDKKSHIKFTTEVRRSGDVERGPTAKMVHFAAQPNYHPTDTRSELHAWDKYQDLGKSSHKNADLMQPGTAFVPQGQKTEMITNPPYQTPDLGDAPAEMQKEADQIYRRLRKDQYHAETKEDRAAASGTMWKILEESWEKNEKTGMWQRKKKE